MDVDIINNLLNTTEVLQQCASLISEWKTTNDEQQHRLDQIGQMVAMVAESSVNLQSVSDQLMSLRAHSSNQFNIKSADALAKQLSISQNILTPAQIKQEVGMAQRQINPLPSEPVPNTFPNMIKSVSLPMLRLNRIHPIKIINNNGAITISSDAQKKPDDENDSVDELTSKKRPNASTLAKARKTRRISVSPSASNDDNVETNDGNSGVVGKQRYKATTSGSGSPSNARRLTRSKSVLTDAETLLASLTEN